MSPIYKCFLIRDFSEAWHSLSEDEKNQLVKKQKQALKDAGGEVVSMYDLFWSGESTKSLGVEKFPNVEAVQKYAESLKKLRWGRYFKAETFLGIDM